MGEIHPVCRKNHYLLVTVAIKAFTVMILERFEINVFYADMLLLLADTSLRALQSGIMLTERLNREESHQHFEFEFSSDHQQSRTCPKITPEHGSRRDFSAVQIVS